MKQAILNLVFRALDKSAIEVPPELKAKISVSAPDQKFGDFATNAALILAKSAKLSPQVLAQKIIGNMEMSLFESALPAGAGFINFRIKTEQLLDYIDSGPKPKVPENNSQGKVLLEYFQPNIAKPLHIGHLRTAIIGDALKRMMIYSGIKVESDTHMGDWGTQFGFLILGCKKLGNFEPSDEELNKIYIELNAQAEKDPSIHEAAKHEFVKLEQGDSENRTIWQQLVALSVQKFLNLAQNFDLLPFDHHWPESFYEDKMPAVIRNLEKKKLLVESQGARIVNLEDQGLGVAVIVKSDGATTYLLRDLATFIFAKEHGFAKHLYVVDNRQSHHYKQLFAILKLMGEMAEGEGEHIDYGFISFKGEALSTRKGNMVLAQDVLEESRKRVAAIIKEKNPDLSDKQHVIHAVSTGALKYYDLSHNRHSDFEFDWDEALDFDGNSGPYLQYAYARLCGILAKANMQGSHSLSNSNISETERALIFKCLGLSDAVDEALNGYLPNLLANYLYELATLVNKFYHQSPVTQEQDEKLRYLRIKIVKLAKTALASGLGLLGMEALEEM